MNRRFAVVPMAFLLMLMMCAAHERLWAQPAAARQILKQRKDESARKGMIYLSREEILEGAKKEGDMLVSPGHDEKIIPLLAAAFKIKYPFIKEVNWRAVTGLPAAQRQLFEMSSGAVALDAISPSTSFWSDYFSQNLFRKFDFKAMVQDGQVQMPAAMVDESGILVWTGGLMSVVAYNTKLVGPDKTPTGWESCLDRQWRGKLTVDTRPYTLVWVLPAWGEEKLLDFAEKLKANNPIWSTGTTSAVTRLVNEEYALICGATVHSTQAMLKRDPTLPVKIVVPNPLGVAFGEPGAVVAQSKNPNRAILWLEFLASKEAQKISDSIQPGRGSFLVEGTVANKLARGANVAICGAGCRERQDKIMTRIAVEAWKLPKVGYSPK